MSARRRYRGHVRLWLLMVLVFTLILSMTVLAIVMTYRLAVEKRYENSLRQQLSGGLRQLSQSGFSEQTAEKLSLQGLRLLVLREENGEILFQEDEGLPFSLPPVQESSRARASRTGNRDDAIILSELVNSTLGTEEGSFFVSDADLKHQKQRSLDNKVLFLCGRDRGKLFCLYLPVESTNAAIDLAIRYATVVSINAWAVSVILLYFLSKQITRPHRRIADTAARIAGLDFSQRCPEALTTELNDLSQSINTMADSLESNVNALQGTNEKLQVELAERIRQQQITADLISNLSHDLKTPIAIISGYAEGLLEGIAKTPEKQQSYYEMILRESERLQTIVCRILALGRMESGETPINPENFDLTLLLDELLDSFQLEIERLGLRLKRVGTRPCMVRTDKACAHQSLLNYVQNAVFHINHGRQIEVRLEDRGALVRVCVRNSSAPIPKEEAARLWEKLYRGDPSRQRHNGEMGLGLSIVKSNMERLGHSYGFENDPDFPGVCFWLELPKAEGLSAPADPSR